MGMASTHAGRAQARRGGRTIEPGQHLPLHSNPLGWPLRHSICERQTAQRKRRRLTLVGVVVEKEREAAEREKEAVARGLGVLEGRGGVVAVEEVLEAA